MRVILRKLLATPEGVFTAGTVLDRADAQSLIDSGQAEAAETPRARPIETATAEPAAETAVTEAPARRRGRAKRE